MTFDDFINQCASECVNAEPAPQPKRMSRAARIKQLRNDEGMSRQDAEAWADFEGDYRPTQS